MASGNRSQAAQGLGLIAPPLGYAVLVLAAPLLTILAYSFFKDGYLVVIREFTLENYRAVWSDPIFHKIMLRSLGVAALVTLVTVALAFPVAYFLSFVVDPRKKSMWLFLITIPFWTSYLIRVFLWKVILGYNGVINSGLKSLGLIEQPLTFILYNVNSMVLTLAHAYAPFAILPIFIALEKIDRSLLEAGRDLGESRAMTFWRVTLPLAMPGVVAGSLLVFTLSASSFITPSLMGGARITVLAGAVYQSVTQTLEWPFAAAQAVILFLGVLLVLVPYARISGPRRG